MRMEGSFGVWGNNPRLVIGGFLGMVLLCACAEAGVYSGGTGAAGSPYLIGSAADIIEMSNTPGDWASNFLMIAVVSRG
jgi:hypothetical protein